MPQLGQLRFLPFKNGAFQNNSLSVVLRADGMLEKLEYKDTKARGELAAATLSNAVGQFAGYADALRAQRDKEAADAAAAVSAARADTLAELAFERDRLLRQAEIDQLVNGPAVGSLAAIQADTELTLARAAQIQAYLRERSALAALIASSQ